MYRGLILTVAIILSSIFVFADDDPLPPTLYVFADAGPNQNVQEGVTVFLNGLGSFSSAELPLSYQWSQVSGTPVELMGATAAMPFFISPQVIPIGETLVFQLVVTDGNEVSIPALVYIMVNHANQAPIADAGDDQTVNMGTTVILDASRSRDPDGDAITYQWAQVAGTPVTLNSSTSVHATFKAPNVPTSGATLTFSLQTKDGQLGSDFALVNIQIKNVNAAPVPDAGITQVVASGSTVALDATNSYDPDGDPLSFAWTQTAGPSVSILNANSAQASFVAPMVPLAGAALSFKVTVSDGKASAAASVTMNVQRDNHAPIANAGDPQTVLEQSAVSLDGSLSKDIDEDPLLYFWEQKSGPVVSLINADQAKTSFIAPDVSVTQTLVFSLRVSDSVLSSVASTVTVTVMPVTAPPNCALARVPDDKIWPPNHKMVPISIVGVFDENSGSGKLIRVTAVTQDEPTNGLGDGDTAIDAIIKNGEVSVRAERKGNGNGRVYKITFEASDNFNQKCTGFVFVKVPQSVNDKNIIDDGQKYNSLN